MNEKRRNGRREGTVREETGRDSEGEERRQRGSVRDKNGWAEM